METGVETHIVVLDDEESILDILDQLLTPKGYVCTSTTSPQEALEFLKNGRFSLLITDVKMPEMNGIEVVEKAKEIDEDLAIIIITALMDVGNAIQAMRVGADDYVLKPFNLREILASIQKALDKRRQQIENRYYQAQLEERVQEATDDLERVNRELRETKQYLENLLHSTHDAIITMDQQGVITFVNQGALRMLGYPEGALAGKPASLVFSGGEEEVKGLWAKFLTPELDTNHETELVKRDGEKVPVSVSLSLVTAANGKVSAMLAICKDVKEQKQLHEELRELSVKDGLTGLYNHRHFHERLEAEVERARRQHRPLSLLLLDLDNFKEYNDSYGHIEGDKALQGIRQAIDDSTRSNVDMGFRYGGDEFTVILPETDHATAANIAERIRQTFERKGFDGTSLSVGVMSYADDMNPSEFLQAADARMYEAKRAGGNQIRGEQAGNLAAQTRNKNPAAE